jgi:hypothetical protein
MSHDDDHQRRLASPSDFASELFAANNKQIFDQFIHLRISGTSAYVAYRMIMGEEYNDNFMQARIWSLEMNSYYQTEFKRQLALAKLSDMWNPKTSAFELLQIVRDPFAKHSARMSAIKELNVIADITIVDESGRTKAGRKLADFYAEEGEKPAAVVEESELPPSDPHTTH